MEVIARKEKRTLWTFVLSMVMGVLLLGINTYSRYLAITLLIVGGIIGVLYFRQPQVFIKYDGEKLIFPQGMYAPSEIKNVTYYRGRKWNFGNGSLKVYMADGQVFSFGFVENVEEVHNRLIALRLDNSMKN